MDKNITISQSKSNMFRTWRCMYVAVNRPLERLRKYYSDVLDEEVSRSRMWRLINAQLAFVAAAFPIEASLTARVVCVAWLVCALLNCRK